MWLWELVVLKITVIVVFLLVNNVKILHLQSKMEEMAFISVFIYFVGISETNTVKSKE